MRSIKMVALILWVIIFMVAAFILGQFLMSKDIFDATKFFTINGEIEKEETVDNGAELENDVIINKIGQETVRIGQNVAKDYFSEYYKEYVNYVMQDMELYETDKKISITDDLASDYVFYAISREKDDQKYTSYETDGKITISEGSLNSFMDKMFEKEVSEKYKENSNNGYDKKVKIYNIVKNEEHKSYTQELIAIKNITSNQIRLEFICQRIIVKDNKSEIAEEKQINIYAVYRGGRYILTEVEKIEK